MIISTTNTIDGKAVTNYLGIVTGCVMAGFPGGAKAVQRGWTTAVEGAQKEMVSQASALGADAILGVKIDAHKSGIGDYLYITGTAVKLG